MPKARAEQAHTVQIAAGVARLAPVQKRSRERFEKILDCAGHLLLEKGGDGFRMSDIVERAGVPFGSLYQYFPDKTAIIGTLAERYNAIGHECVRTELESIQGLEDLRPALGRITDGFYRMYQDEPVMMVIWQATLADRALQDLDRLDCETLANLLDAAVRRFVDGDPKDIKAFSRLSMTMIGAVVRYAITLEPPDARRVLAQFKQMLPSPPTIRP